MWMDQNVIRPFHEVTFTPSLPLTFQNIPLDLAPGDAKELIDVSRPQRSEHHHLCMQLFLFWGKETALGTPATIIPKASHRDAETWKPLRVPSHPSLQLSLYPVLLFLQLVWTHPTPSSSLQPDFAS